MELAWWAGDDPKVDEARDLNDAAQLFAMAMAELWLVLLSAIIVWVMHRGFGQIASESLGKIAGSAAFKQAMGEMRGKAGKLGSGFGIGSRRISRIFDGMLGNGRRHYGRLRVRVGVKLNPRVAGLRLSVRVLHPAPPVPLPKPISTEVCEHLTESCRKDWRRSWYARRRQS